MKKQKYRRIKSSAPSHTAGKQQRQHLNPDNPAPEHLLLTILSFNSRSLWFYKLLSHPPQPPAARLFLIISLEEFTVLLSPELPRVHYVSCGLSHHCILHAWDLLNFYSISKILSNSAVNLSVLGFHCRLDWQIQGKANDFSFANHVLLLSHP